MESAPLRACIVDDERLAIERLERLLAKFPQLRVVGTAIDPSAALERLRKDPVDVLFLDIQMPGMSGFELLAQLADQPFVIFTTAYDEYALRAFEVNSIDYLLKPVEPAQLARALAKLDRLRPSAKAEWQQNPDLKTLLREMAAELGVGQPAYPRRIASRVGERVTFLPLDSVTHFLAHDKLTYAVVAGARHPVDHSIADLERRLDPTRFLRIHRAAMVNVEWIHEVDSWFAGKVVVSLKDAGHTRLTVARDRVRLLKSRLGA